MNDEGFTKNEGNPFQQPPLHGAIKAFAFRIRATMVRRWTHTNTAFPQGYVIKWSSSHQGGTDHSDQRHAK
ncbi:MAG: hypothetical protein AVDCRST_MAG93-2185, partial [uncultured Chloroflexia bacterium]